MKLSPQETLIIDYLADGKLKCMSCSDFRMKDDRARIAKLRDKGYVFDDENPVWCKGECGTPHISKMLMRKLLASPKTDEITPKTAPPQGFTPKYEESLSQAECARLNAEFQTSLF